MMKRFISLITALCMTFTLFTGSVSVLADESEPVIAETTVESAVEDAAEAETAESSDSSESGRSNYQEMNIKEIDGSDIDVDLKNADGVSDLSLLEAIEMDEDELIPIIIVLDGDSVLEANINAVANDETEALEQSLDALQEEVIEEIEEDILGEPMTVTYKFTWLVNGIACVVPYGSIADIARLDAVKRIVFQRVYEPCDTDVETTSNVYYPDTVSDGETIGREDTWNDYGYMGEGMVIAIVDTGIDSDHPNFAALDSSVAVRSDVSTIEDVLTSLNAYERSGASASDLYLNSKIAFGFNYCDYDLDITHDNDDEGDHGTHVAGIAAANKIDGSDVVGVAPNAQLYVMKVFGKNGGAYDADIIAALEDALILGADVVNMSLGASAGFTTSTDDFINDVYNSVAEHGTILSVSAGNAYTMGYGNAFGTDSNLTEDVDNSVISSPSIYSNVLSVASMENVFYYSDCIVLGDYYIGYSDGSYGANEPLSSLAGQSLQIVAVPGTGDVDDYEGLDVSGKIALVQRGTLSFVQKCMNAAEQGAAACLIYNNTSGTISMDLSDCTATIPCASITLADGEYIVAALESDPDLYITVSEAGALVPSDVGGQMSDFSSWGVAPDLSLEPDITAPGGNIYSTLDGGGYGLMSGTSMAAPNVAGMSALIVQYLKNTYGYSGSYLHYMAKALLMSAASPIAYDNELYYSPRQQGSGLANVYDAISTGAFLSVDGCDTPKAELGELSDSSVRIDYYVNNFSDKDLYYDLNTVVQTEGVDDTYYEDYGYYFMSMTPYGLTADTSESSENMVYTHDLNDDTDTDSHDAYWLYQSAIAGAPYDEDWQDVEFRYEIDGNEGVNSDDVQAYLDALVGNDEIAAEELEDKVLKVDAGSTATVSVTIDLSDDAISYFDTYYPNGGYVEGFTFLTAKNTDGTDLSLPYLGFYGSWDAAPVFEASDATYFYGGENAEEYKQYYSVLWTDFAGYESYWVPGLNPYDDGTFEYEDYIDPDHISLSPDFDGYSDYLDDIYLSLMRNAGTLRISYVSDDGETVYDSQEIEHVEKSYYFSSYGLCYPFILSEYVYYGAADNYYLTDENGDVLPNNTVVHLVIEGEIDYDGARTNVIDIPIVVDTEAPELIEAASYEKDGEYYLELTFKDNVSVAAMNLLSSTGVSVLGQYETPDADAVTDEDDDEYLVWTESYKVTGLGEEFVVVLGDYACNESYWEVSVPGNPIDVDTDLLYGYRVADQDYYGSDYLFGWIGMEIVPDEEDETATAVDVTIMDSEYYMDYALTAAEQIGGYILAVDADYNLVWIKPGYWDDRHLITNLGVNIRDLAWDATTETLYGVTSSKLVTIDLETGELTNVTSGSLYNIYTIAFDEEGNLYGVYGTSTSAHGMFYSINKETGMMDEMLLSSTENFPRVAYSQSMTYKDGYFYWAQYSASSSGEAGELYLIWQDDEGSWNFESQGVIAGHAEVVGLLWLDNNDYEWPEAELESLAVSPEASVLVKGNTAELTAAMTPWYCGASLTWESDDEDVATVSQSGRVTAVGVGTALITVSSGEISASATVTVVDPTSELNGFIISSYYYDLYNQWAAFDANATERYSVLTDEQTVTFTAGEYVDGVIYAYDETGGFYKIDPEDYSYTKVSSIGTSCQMWDMAYDYTTGKLYGLLMNYDYYETELVEIDRLTGNYEYIDYLDDGRWNLAVAMAVDDNGIIYYVCDGYGYLCSYDPEEWESTVIGLTGYTPYTIIQSMAYDHDTDELYWAAYSYESLGLLYLDVNTGAAVDLGTVDYGSEISCLYIVPENPPETPYVAVTDVELTDDTVSILEGGSKVAPVTVYPFNATDRDVTWVVEDETVAVIEDGVIYGLSAGTTTATGTLNSFTVTLTIEILESAGEFRAYVNGDYVYGTSGYWVKMYDYDIHLPGIDDLVFIYYDIFARAAAYYDGYVWMYGDDEDGDMHLVQVDAETGDTATDFLLDCDYYLNIMDMAFDYTQGCMYGVGNTLNTENNSTLYAFDLSDGTIYTIAALDDYLLAIACSADGTLYAVNSDGTLYTVDKVTGELTYVGDTGYPAHGYQSMAFDYDSGRLYWARSYFVQGFWGASTMESSFLLVDTSDASASEIGDANAMLTGLYFPTDNEPAVPETVEPTGIALNSTSVLLTAGETAQLVYTLLPVSIRDVSGTVNFSSSNSSVATIDGSGTITAISTGSAVITASCGSAVATCTVNVVGDDTYIYGVNTNGWEKTSLLSPSQVKETASLSKDYENLIVKAAYNTSDGYVYAIDETGYIWKMTLDLNYVTQVGETSIYECEELDDYIWYTADTIDLAYNPYSGKLYALVGDYYCNDRYDYGYYDGYYLVEVDCEEPSNSEVTGAFSAETVTSITFRSADKVMFFDVFEDYLYEISIDAFDDDPTEILWTQGQYLYADTVTMVYSKELGKLFMVAIDPYFGSGNQTLYMADLATGELTKLGDGEWTNHVASLMLIEGATPATTLSVAPKDDADEDVDDEADEDLDDAAEEDVTEEDISEEDASEEDVAGEDISEDTSGSVDEDSADDSEAPEGGEDEEQGADDALPPDDSYGVGEEPDGEEGYEDASEDVSEDEEAADDGAEAADEAADEDGAE